MEFRVGEGLSSEQTKVAYDTIATPDITKIDKVPENSFWGVAKQTVKNIGQAVKTEFSARDVPVPVRRMFEADPVQTDRSPFVTQVGSLGFSLVELIPRAAATIYGELFAPDRKAGSVKLPINAKRLGYEDTLYPTAAKQVTDDIGNGTPPAIAALRIFSEKTLDVAFGAELTTQVLKSIETNLLRGGVESRLAAWETLGRPSTIEEANVNKITQTNQALQATKDLELSAREKVVSKVNNTLNKSVKILKDKGIPTLFDQAKSKAAAVAEVASRQTPIRLAETDAEGKLTGRIDKNFKSDVKGFTKPDIGLKKPAIEPVVPYKQLPGTAERAGQPRAVGLSTKEVENVGYGGEKDITTSILEKLKGRDTVSKQFISDLTNAGDLKQVEREIIRATLKDFPDKVDVKAFAKAVKAELLPLKIRDTLHMNHDADIEEWEGPEDMRPDPETDFQGQESARYEGISLPDHQRGNVANYAEHIYESPIKTSAGDTHFHGVSDNYFGHTRVEDMADKSNLEAYKKTFIETGKVPKTGTRRIIEVQSDLYQKGNLEREVKENEQKRKSAREFEGLVLGSEQNINRLENQSKGFSKLQQYNDPTAHFRMIREEVKQAAKDGKTKLQFPTGETAMKIEGLGGGEVRWTFDNQGPATPSELKVGKKIWESEPGIGMTDEESPWIITGVLGDGKFKAVPSQKISSGKDNTITKYNDLKNNPIEAENYRAQLEEEFDISGKVDTNNPIYKFYEKEVGSYLKNKYNATKITDDKGVTWWEVPVKKEYASLPIQAFGAVGGIEQDKDGKLHFNPVKAAFGLVAFTAMERSGAIELIDQLIADGKVRVVQRGTKDVFQIMKGKKWVNVRDAESAVKQLTEKYVPKPKEYSPADQEKLDRNAAHLETVREQLAEHPAKGLLKFIDKKEGQFTDLKNPNAAKNAAEAARIRAKNQKVAIAAQTAFEGHPELTDQFDDPDTIREVIDDYKAYRYTEKSLVQQKKELNETLVPVSGRVKPEPIRIGQVDTTAGEGRSLEMMSEDAQNMIDGEPFPYDFNPVEAIEKTITNVKQKVHIIDTYLRTPAAVMQKIGFGKEAEMLQNGADAYWKELPKNIDKISAWISRLKTPEAQEAVFDYLDGKPITLHQKEKDVALEIKGWLKEWAKRLDLPEENRIGHYITHLFSDELVNKEFDEDLAKIITDKIPTETYDPFLQKRLGVKGYKRDLGPALDAYAKRATRKVHMDPALEAINDHAGASLEFSNIEKSQFQYIQKYVNNIQMRPGEFEEGVDNLVKSVVGYRYGQRPVIRALTGLRQMVFRGALGLNPASAIRNLSQGINTYATLGEKYTALGYLGLFNKGATEELMREGVLNAGVIQDRALSSGKKVLQAFDKGLFFMFDQAEKINRGAAYFGAKKKFIAEHTRVLNGQKLYSATEADAIKYAKSIVRKTQFAFDPINTPVGLSNPIAKTLLTFQTFTVKQLEFLAGMAKDSATGGEKMKNFLGLVRYAVAGLAFVYTIGRAFGMEPKELLPWFRFETPAPLKLPVEIVKAGLDTPDKYGNQRSIAQKGKDIVDAGVNFIPAGSELKKVIQGSQAIKEGGSYTSNDHLQFKQGDGLASQVQTLLFGKYASGAAKDYFNGKSAAQEEYERLKKLPKDEANAQAKEIKKNDPSLFAGIKAVAQDEKLGITAEDKKIRALGVENGKRADYIYKKTLKLKTKEEKNAYLKDLAKKKIISFDKYVEGDKAGQYKNATLLQIIALAKADK